MDKKKKLAEALRKNVSDKPVNIIINFDMSALAEALKEKSDEFQKTEGLTPSVS